jgi:membrane fusion protein, peptide pheromone/bacteriocin exporter
LIAEIYASPNDIGFLKVGMRTRMHVSAFHYHQWGLLEGVVKDISNDVMLVNNQPVFKVRCSLKQDFLTLKSGYVGKLKKGMTVQARFLVAERTLWQLLFDKADDWLNPNIKN